MKLYIRQKVFSWVDQFTVKDETGADKYFVEGEFFSWGKKLHVSDVFGRETAFIQQKVFSFLPKFFVFIEGEQIAEIVKEFTFLSPKYSIEGLGWEINGSFMAHDYEITQHGRPIVRIHKEWMTWGDCYELEIANEQDEMIALSVVLAIDCVMAADAAGASAGANAGN
ncbi:LURP-one-related/scramblase family protein [Clostridium aminobutyricum]|uniref:LURP-one-related family protein n=1 Tax=Clostridium aminobutyricum TaxID=33953 RepID=A0A939D8Z6_CLOAM|nr:LURP-one-related family protein [Clostridium aminobutyricum]MBN7773614.1 LURP-one-related family protein [Clostridium aminobutyricum]